MKKTTWMLLNRIKMYHLRGFSTIFLITVCPVFLLRLYFSCLQLCGRLSIVDECLRCAKCWPSSRILLEEKTGDVVSLCTSYKVPQTLPWRSPVCPRWTLPPSCRDGVGGHRAPHLLWGPDQHLLEHREHAAGLDSLPGEGMALALSRRNRTLSSEHYLPVVSAAPCSLRAVVCFPCPVSMSNITVLGLE